MDGSTQMHVPVDIERRPSGSDFLTLRLGLYQDAIKSVLSGVQENRIISRIWSHDHTVWRQDKEEITNRLGWLRIAETMQDEYARLKSLEEEVRAEGYTDALLFGMGGSSLAPEVFQSTFGLASGYLDLSILDSTDPGALLDHEKRLDLSRTLFIVSTKSGGTVETLSFFKYFYNRVSEIVGKENAGEHFVAITDPGSKLVEIAERFGFRATFLNDPDIGGRYSVLSFFGLVPAQLIGINVPEILERALEMISLSREEKDIEDNPSALLGAIMGELAKRGRDKVTIVASPAISSFGDWIEQLIAESTGKDGTGILPVIENTVGNNVAYGDDCLFVYLRLDGDDTFDTAIDNLGAAGHPVVTIHLHDIYDLGGQFFLWEFATAVAGHIINIHPFDQPNVEAAKILARKMVAEYYEKGELPEQIPDFTDNGITVYGEVTAENAKDALIDFLDQSTTGDYVSIQAYLHPTAETSAILDAMKSAIRERTGLAVTTGYGPRFLHSTGQLHKGDGGNGLFIQLTADSTEDLAIPDEAGTTASSITFGVLKSAQAMGDRQALLDAGRRVIRFHLGTHAIPGLNRLMESIG